MSLDAHHSLRVHTSFPPVAFTRLEPELSYAAPPSDPARFRRWRNRQALTLLTADLLVLTAAAAVVARPCSP